SERDYGRKHMDQFRRRLLRPAGLQPGPRSSLSELVHVLAAVIPFRVEQVVRLAGETNDVQGVLSSAREGNGVVELERHGLAAAAATGIDVRALSSVACEHGPAYRS